jgi:hypothetical protein
VTEDYAGAQAILVGNHMTPSAYIGDCDPTTDDACVRFRLRSDDRFFTLEVDDQTGAPVYAVAFGPDGSEVGEVCGEKTEPLPSPGAFVDVWLTYGSCFDSVSPSVPTVGVVEATFSRYRSAL